MFRSCCGIILLIFAWILLYVAVPIVFVIVTVPIIVVFLYKKLVEMVELLRNKCKSYRRLSVEPAMNKYFDRIGIR